MSYVIAVYGIIWAGILLYLLHLGRRERALERRIREVWTLLSKDGSSGTGP